MTTGLKSAANRRNAQASTGPKTAKGKARSSRNAYRHGLSLSVLSDPLVSYQAEALAEEIAGKGATTTSLAFARRIAEAQIDLVRIRKVRHELMACIADPHHSPVVSPRFAKRKVNRPEKSDSKVSVRFVEIGGELMTLYTALDRYERRALSRRKFAIRDFDSIMRAPELRTSA